ncbi:MAG: hypothetical protein J0H98_06855 [Solirubrobacterales bacterium]|nr:hypothetical protein [Solirubrobacterales bacterium]
MTRILKPLPLVAAVLAFFVPSASQAASPNREVIAEASTRAVTDGARYLAYQRADGVSVAHDSWRGKTVEILGAENCEPATVGAGQVGLDCAKSENARWTNGRPRIASVLTGKSRPVLGALDGDVLWRIGSRWIAGVHPCHAPSPHCSGQWFLINRRTHARIRTDEAEYSLNRPRPSKVKPPRYWRAMPGKLRRGTLAYSGNMVVADDGKSLSLWKGRRSKLRLAPSAWRAQRFPVWDNYGSVKIAQGRVFWEDLENRVHIVRTDGSGAQVVAFEGSRYLDPRSLRDGVVVSVSDRREASGGEPTFELVLVRDLP